MSLMRANFPDISLILLYTIPSGVSPWLSSESTAAMAVVLSDSRSASSKASLARLSSKVSVGDELPDGDLAEVVLCELPLRAIYGAGDLGVGVVKATASLFLP